MGVLLTPAQQAKERVCCFACAVGGCSVRSAAGSGKQCQAQGGVHGGTGSNAPCSAYFPATTASRHAAHELTRRTRLLAATAHVRPFVTIVTNFQLVNAIRVCPTFHAYTQHQPHVPQLRAAGTALRSHSMRMRWRKERGQ